MSEIKTLSFFGDTGISSTSANHIANLAKEHVRKLHQKLNSISFVDEEISLLTDGSKFVSKTGMNYEQLNTIAGMISSIAEANSLIAFLREAIKEKERRFKQAREYVDAEIYDELTSTLSEVRDSRPERLKYPTEEDIKMEWTVGEQERYLSLEAEAAIIGKMIHEDGPLSVARMELSEKLLAPNRVCANGRDTIIYSYRPSADLTVADVDDLYDSLQAKHRSVQAELNGMKKRIEDTILERKMAIDNAYNEAMREYHNKERECQIALDAFQRDMEKKRDELAKEVQNLKIVIPNRLKPMYDLLNGKK